MPLAETLLIVLLVAVALLLVLQTAVLLRGDGGTRLEQALREEQRAGRAELTQSVEQFRGSLENLRAGLAEDARKAREESRQVLQQFGEQLQHRLVQLTGDNEKRMGEMRTTLEARLKAIQEDNTAKLEQMRATVDEKLQATLETRLGQSFELVSKRLEEVQRGLGEMKELATGVGDLKRVLGNVKTRGIFGEVQLGALLEQLLTADQYVTNVATAPGSSERVEFAIRFPGTHADQPLLLPIDAKFPREDYERLLDAREHADVEAAGAAALALERRVRDEAKRICDKYIAPPHTTDFALLFLPTEGLYAEVISRPGLFEALQQQHRVTIAGPSTLSAMLNSFRMGFRTLAIEQRSSEVWQVLAAVKGEFGKFAGILEKAEKQINTVGKSIGEAGRKTRTIERRLRGVETLPTADAKVLIDEVLPVSDGDEDADTIDAAE
ncbi:MAG TPA: DNA recombination protein RmuC [Rhodanobacteraceae bacterium]|nr:DNA recombination protein RmuC [Rhodanobacteraceae bacterium]